MDITAIHQIFLTCTSVTTDSRNCPQGSLFIALKGESFNGNAFAARALESGSAYAIVDEEAYAPAGDTRYIVVENSLKTLQQLANYHRRQMRTPIIGITGTNGKTTTKELMSTVLSQTHNVLYTLGNLNNHIGVPLTLLRLRPEHDLAVVEMGASHPGDIKELVEIAEPDYGIITNVGKAHLEGFGFGKTMEHNYELLSHLEEFRIFELPLLVGVSRKSMIYRLLDITPQEALNGTTVLDTICLLKGADILRVHDVKEAVETVRIVQAMRNNS